MPGPRATALAVPPPRIDWRSFALVLLWAALLGAGLWAVRWTSAGSHAQGDTFWYTRQALLFAGYAEPDATATAAEFIVGHGRGSDPSQWIAIAETIDRRYVGIFESRPVYPLVAASLVGVLGTGAMSAAALAAAIVFSIALAALVWPAAGAIATLGALVAAFVLPSGGWFTVLYADGWMFALLAASFAAAAAYLRTGRRTWLAVFALFLGVLYATKSANGTVLVVATLALAVVSAARARTLRTPVVALGAVAAIVGAAMTIGFAVLGLPGLGESVQDLLTGHFELPDVASPWLPLAQRAAGLGRASLIALAGQPVVVAIAAIGLGALLATRSWWAGLVAFSGLATVLTVAVHPVYSEIPRLMAPIWISIAVGWGLLAAVAARWVRGRLSAVDKSPIPV